MVSFPLDGDWSLMRIDPRQKPDNRRWWRPKAANAPPYSIAMEA
jgi:hypothetical protein